MVSSDLSTKQVLMPAIVAALGLGIAVYATCWFSRPYSRRRRFGSYSTMSWIRTLLFLRHKHLSIVNSREECSPALKRILRECREHRYVGFDCEWRPQRVRGEQKRPVALLQLASPKGSCVLFRLCKIGFIPEEIKAILRDPHLLKVGVDTMNDAKLLLKDYGSPVRGCLDLRYLVTVSKRQPVSTSQPKTTSIDQDINAGDLESQMAVVDNQKVQEQVELEVKTDSQTIQISVETSFTVASGNQGPGLAKMAENILGVILDKNWRIRCSDWEADTLSSEQVKYAVNDALVSALMFAKITGLSKSFWPPWRKREPTPVLNIIYISYHGKNVGDSRTVKKSSLQARQPSFKNQSRALSLSVRQKPLYDNCAILAPDGEVLCTCTKAKALWYLSKGLADQVEDRDDSIVVKLKFEPSVRGTHVSPDYKYYTLSKQNICVVCGADKSFVKKQIIPHEYRMHFPKAAKGYHSHDILLMCVSCSIQANYAIQPVCYAAKALLNTTHTIPADRIQELKIIVADYYQLPTTDHISMEILQQASKLGYRVENPEYEPHGQRVVRFFQTQHGESKGPQELERLFRTHFLEAMKPQYLPELWSIDHLHNP
ncbi:hypothetical protein B566_EDAN015347 [Ephemera danica]|nr:hypothetical protein B566_EDAN015347 [Ephemera danica]